MLIRWLRTMAAQTVKPKCPECGKVVPADDVDAEKDMVFCRECGRLSFLNRTDSTDPVNEIMQAWSLQDDALSRPESAKTRLEESGRDIVLRRRTGSIVLGVFLAMGLVLLTVGCVTILRSILTGSPPPAMCAAVFFVALWFVVFVLLMNAWFGRERLKVGPAGLDYRWTMLIMRDRQQVDLADVQEITRFAKAHDSGSGDRKYGLRIQTASGSIKFGKGLADDELLWLADVLRRHIHVYDFRSPVVEPSRPRVDKVSDEAASDRSPVEVLKPTIPPRDRPAKARFVVRYGQNRTEFVRKASMRGMLGPLGFMTFINLFWNGLVCVFILQLIAEFKWTSFLFLLPLAVIGLVILATWLFLLIGPLTGDRCVFTPGRASRKSSLLGIGRTRHYDLGNLDRLELRHSSKDKDETESDMDDGEEDTMCSLVLVDDGGEDVMEIGALGENEVRWIADLLFRDFREWFVRIGKSGFGR